MKVLHGEAGSADEQFQAGSADKHYHVVCRGMGRSHKGDNSELLESYENATVC